MIDNTRVYRCSCKVKGLAHVFTAASTKPYIVLVDPGRVHLLRDASWSVAPMHRKSKVLRARATTSAPGIKIGRQLHKLAKGTWKGKRLWAINRNYLDCRRDNLRFVSHADAIILSRARPSTKAVGVSRGNPPTWMKTCFRPYQARIRVDGKDLHLGAFATLVEGQAAWDAAAIKVRGPNTTTNQTLGLLDPEVARTKLCRRAAKQARYVIKEFWSGELLKRYEALKTARTHAERVAIFKGLREIGQPTPGPSEASVATH